MRKVLDLICLSYFSDSLIHDFLKHLQSVDDSCFTSANIGEIAKKFSQQNNIKQSDLFTILRHVLTGTSVGAGTKYNND